MARKIVFTPKAAKPPPTYSQAVKAGGEGVTWSRMVLARGHPASLERTSR